MVIDETGHVQRKKHPEAASLFVVRGMDGMLLHATRQAPTETGVECVIGGGMRLHHAPQGEEMMRTLSVDLTGLI